jgi:Tfp pilus assembly protein PilV
MNRTVVTSLLLGVGLLGAQALLLTAQAQQNAPKQQPKQQQTTVPAHQTASEQLKTAAQGSSQAGKVFDGKRGTSSTPVQVQTSTQTASAATIAAQQNAAERARQGQTSKKYGIDKVKVP